MIFAIAIMVIIIVIIVMVIAIVVIMIVIVIIVIVIVIVVVFVIIVILRLLACFFVLPVNAAQNMFAVVLSQADDKLSCGPFIIRLLGGWHAL